MKTHFWFYCYCWLIWTCYVFSSSSQNSNLHLPVAGCSLIVKQLKMIENKHGITKGNEMKVVPRVILTTNSSTDVVMQNETCPHDDSNDNVVSKPLFSFNITNLTISITFGNQQDVSKRDLEGFQVLIKVFDSEGTLKNELRQYFCLKGNFNESEEQIEVTSDCYGYIYPGYRVRAIVQALPGSESSEKLNEMLMNFSDNRNHNHKSHKLNDKTPKQYIVPSCDKNNAFKRLCFCQKLLPIRADYSFTDKHLLVTVMISQCLGNKVTVTLSSKSSLDRVIWKKDVITNGNLLNSTFEIPLVNLNLCENATMRFSGNVNQTNIVIPSSKCLKKDPSLALTIFLVALAFIACLMCIYLNYNRFKLKCLSNPKSVEETASNNEYEVAELSIRRTKVYLGFYDSDPVFLNLIIQFATYLKVNLGLDVVFEPWNEEEVEQGLAVWVEKALTVCDKFILVWSSSSSKLMENLHLANNLQSSGFVPIALQLKSELLKCTMKKNNFISVYFDSRCAKSIPVWFCRLIDRHFFLMEQFSELYYNIVDQEPYNPGKKLIINFDDAEESFRLALEFYRSSFEKQLDYLDEKNVIKDFIKTNNLEIQPPVDGDMFDSDKDLDIVPPREVVEEINDLVVQPPEFY